MTTVNKYGYARLHEDPLLHVPHAYIGEKVPVSYTATDVKIRYNYDIIAATGTTTAIPPLPSTSAPSTVQLWGGAAGAGRRHARGYGTPRTGKDPILESGQ